MILLTGAAGFIGSNILAALNARGCDDVIVVEDLTDGTKCANLSGKSFADYLDVSELAEAMTYDSLPRLSGICHQGACVDTTVRDGRAVMKANYTFSKSLLTLAERHRCPLVYASSASVYGDGRNGFVEDINCERPQAPYAFSKWAFDQYLRKRFLNAATAPAIPVTGLRYFNVYGPGEDHKGRMASVAWHCFEAIQKGAAPKLFEGSDGFLRDFIYVGDVAAINLHFLDESPDRNERLSIVNVGTGVPRSFADVGRCISVISGGPVPVTIPFPADLCGQYQAYTCADTTRLRAAGYAAAFTSLEEGLAASYAAAQERKKSA
jgi:ADP-L-glycero-D-manno-heptose 6-epimerase